jgi:hypothetical protein
MNWPSRFEKAARTWMRRGRRFGLSVTVLGLPAMRR